MLLFVCNNIILAHVDYVYTSIYIYKFRGKCQCHMFPAILDRRDRDNRGVKVNNIYRID